MTVCCWYAQTDRAGWLLLGTAQFPLYFLQAFQRPLAML